MKIGIISEKTHVKSHVKSLEAAGHEVILLDGSPKSIPDSIDVIVCRTLGSSHGAFDLATQARRDGRRVVYEDSVTRVVAAIKKIERSDAAGAPEDLTAPIRGAFFRAYRDARKGYWYIKTGRKWREHVGTQTTREGAFAEVERLDGLKLRARPDPDVVVKVEVIEPVVEPKVPVLVRAKGHHEDLEVAVGLVLAELQKLALFEYMSPLGVEIAVMRTHLQGPHGPACGEGVKRTTQLSEVTCPECKSSELHTTATWVLANLGSA